MAILRFPNFINGKILTIEFFNLGPGEIFRKGGTKIKKLKKNISSTKYIKWILLGMKKLKKHDKKTFRSI
jgi:hypothetical protein